jgi:PST family polysaccharide transporter
LSLARAAILGASANWLGAVGGFLIRFLINATLARLVLPQIYGEFALAFVYTEFIGLAAAASPSQAIVQLDEPPEALFPSVLTLNLALALLVFLISVVAYPFAAMANGTRVAELVAVLGAIRAAGIVAGTFESFLQRNLAFGRLALLRILGIILSAAGSIAVALAGRPLTALLAREALPLVITYMAMSLAMRRELRAMIGPQGRQFLFMGRIWKLCRSLFWVRMITIACQRLDQLVLTAFVGRSDLAYYWQAVYLAGLPNAGVAPATQTVALRVFVSLAKEDLRLRRAFELLQVSVGYVLAVAAIAFVACPRVIVRVAFGPKWTPVADILPYLAPWIILLPLSQNLQTLLMALQRWSVIRRSLIAQAIVLVVSVPVLAGRFGVRGAAVAVLLALVVNQVVMRVALERDLRGRLASFRGLFAGLAAGGTVAAVPAASFNHLGATITQFELGRACLAVVACGVVAFVVDRRNLRETIVYVWGQLRRRSVGREDGSRSPGRTTGAA